MPLKPAYDSKELAHLLYSVDYVLACLAPRPRTVHPSAHHSSFPNSSEESFRKLAVISQKLTQSRQISSKEPFCNYESAYQYASCGLVLTEDDKLKYFPHLFKMTLLYTIRTEENENISSSMTHLAEVGGNLPLFQNSNILAGDCLPFKLKSLRKSQPVRQRLWIN